MSFNVFMALALALYAVHRPQQPQAGAVHQHSRQGSTGLAPSVTRASLPPAPAAGKPVSPPGWLNAPDPLEPSWQFPLSASPPTRAPEEVLKQHQKGKVGREHSVSLFPGLQGGGSQTEPWESRNREKGPPVAVLQRPGEMGRTASTSSPVALFQNPGQPDTAGQEAAAPRGQGRHRNSFILPQEVTAQQGARTDSLLPQVLLPVPTPAGAPPRESNTRIGQWKGTCTPHSLSF